MQISQVHCRYKRYNDRKVHEVTIFEVSGAPHLKDFSYATSRLSQHAGPTGPLCLK
jgi:hypothetical protein